MSMLKSEFPASMNLRNKAIFQVPQQNFASRIVWGQFTTEKNHHFVIQFRLIYSAFDSRFKID